jgi:hypothetical protein
VPSIHQDGAVTQGAIAHYLDENVRRASVIQACSAKAKTLASM